MISAGLTRQKSGRGSSPSTFMGGKRVGLMPGVAASLPEAHPAAAAAADARMKPRLLKHTFDMVTLSISNHPARHKEEIC
jgi:hypothetical protein